MSINALVMSVRSMLYCGKAALHTTAPGAVENDYSERGARRDFANIVEVHKRLGWSSNKMFKDS